MPFHDLLTMKHVHRQTAADYLGIPVEEVTDEQRRTIGKVINIGKHYGMGREALLAAMERAAPAAGIDGLSALLPNRIGLVQPPDEFLWWWGY